MGKLLTSDQVLLDVQPYVDVMDITPDPQVVEFQHQEMYACGLCDTEEQAACCCDEPPEKTEYTETEDGDIVPVLKFVPSNKTITIDELYSMEDEEGDPLIPEPVDDMGRTIGAYVQDKFRDMLDEIVSNRRVFRFKEAEVPRAKRIIEESTMSRDELIRKYVTDEEIDIIKIELANIFGHTIYVD